MSKITLTKQLRKKILYIEKNGKIINISPNVTPREAIGLCRVCEEPVYAAPGQLLKWEAGLSGEHLYTHKYCRKAQNL